MRNTSYRRTLTGLACWLFSYLFAFSQTLEIHQINVGQGDASLIIVRDTAKLRQLLDINHIRVPIDRMEMLDSALKHKVSLPALENTINKAVLIDTGNGTTQATKIITYMKEVGISKLDYLIISHYDDDHVGGAPKIIDQYPITNIVDRSHYKINPRTNTITHPSKKYINALTNKNINRKTPAPGTLINLNTANTIQLLCTSVNSYVLGEDTTKVLLRKKAKDENDLSVSWVLQYGCFRFFTGGDLSGYNVSPKMDIETPLVNAIKSKDASNFINYKQKKNLPKGHVCVCKVNHHGSNHSTNDHFLDVFCPQVAIISAGCDAGYKHPNNKPIEKFESLPLLEKYLATTVCAYPIYENDDYKKAHEKMEKMTGKGIIGGDIIIIVDDTFIGLQSRYSIRWNGSWPEKPGKFAGTIRNPAVKGCQIFQCHKVKDTEKDLMYIN